LSSELFASLDFLLWHMHMAALNNSTYSLIRISKTFLHNPGTLPQWLVHLHVLQRLALVVQVHIKELQIILNLQHVANHLQLKLLG
jgi:hypothetical protein